MKYLMSFALLFLIFTGCSIEGKTALEKIFEFPEEQMGYGSVNSTDDSLLITFYNFDEERWIFHQKNGVKIENASNGIFSPDGRYYVYEKDNKLYICDKNDKLINSVSVNDIYYPVVWSYDSKGIYFCEQSEKTTAYYFDIIKETKKEILKSNNIYFRPISTKEENILYFLENTTPNEAESECHIVSFNLLTKRFERIKLPKIKELHIFQEYTISPNGQIILFENIADAFIYVVDVKENQILDKIKIEMNASVGGFSWKSDGSYVIFTMTQREIYKYTIPKY